MKTLTVKDLMVPTSDYATISARGTLREAALALQAAQRREQRLDPSRHRDRAVLVVDDEDQVLGKLSMLDVLSGLAPRYDRVKGSGTTSKGATRVGSARRFIRSMSQDVGLWNKPLSNLVEKASTVTVKDLIRPLSDGEIVQENTTLDRAVHQLITGRFQSLLVTRDRKIVGILRLTDVYELISKMLRSHDTGDNTDDR